MAPVVSEPPSILARVDRLDVMLGYLEEMRSGRRSPAASTTSSGTMTTTSDGGGDGGGGGNGNSSSLNSSPASVTRQRRRCRPIDDVVVETREKGNLVDRIDRLEVRILKLEEDIVFKKREEDNIEKSPRSAEKRRHGKGLKRLVKSCVNGGLKTK